MARGDLVTTLLPPEQGVRSDLAPFRLPLEAIPADHARNVVWRDGKLVNRPGLKQVGTNTVTGRPMGGIRFKPQGTTKDVVVTTTGVYNLASGAWADITGSALTGTANDPVRFAVFPQGGADYLMLTNRADPIQEWDGAAGTVTALAGSPPRASDITTSTNRVVVFDLNDGAGTLYPYRIQWSDFNDRTGWTLSSFADISDTPDVIVGGRALSRISFAVYKEETQWVGLAQAGLFPFRFEQKDQRPGPCGPAAIVEAEGRHYYLGADGSFYVFDGIRATHIGEPIRRFILRNLNFARKRRVFGTFMRRDRDIYWWLPTDATADPLVAVSLNVDTGRFFIHEFQEKASCAFSWASVSGATWNSVTTTWNSQTLTWNQFAADSTPAEMIGGVGGKMMRFGIDATDDGTAPTAKWRFQDLQPGGRGKRVRVQSLDTFFDQTATALPVTVKVGSTDTLGAAPTFPAALQATVAIGTDELHQVNLDQVAHGSGTGNAEARFISVHHELITDQDWAWSGADLLTFRRETS